MPSYKLPRGNGFKRKCQNCGVVNPLKVLKCKCGFDFLAARTNKRLKEIRKRVEQGRNNRNYNNSTRMIAKAMDTLGLFYGFGYEAVFIYHTASNKRPETHLLYHGIDNSIAAKFAKSEEAEGCKRVFGGFIKFEKAKQISNNITHNDTNDLATRPTISNNAPNDSQGTDVQPECTNVLPEPDVVERTFTPQDETVETEEDGVVHIDISELEKATGVNFATFENEENYDVEVPLVYIDSNRMAAEDELHAEKVDQMEIIEPMQMTSADVQHAENEDKMDRIEPMQIEAKDVPHAENEDKMDRIEPKQIMAEDVQHAEIDNQIDRIETRQEINCEQQGLFRGMKVEAEDTANKLICCATICQIKKDKLRIHFDGWGQTYDFWTTVSDNKIHFVGWCEEMGIPLCPPKDCCNVAEFTWENYLRDSGSKPATLSDFKYEEAKLIRKRFSAPRKPKQIKKKRN